jgi:hypothetical protein
MNYRYLKMMYSGQYLDLRGMPLVVWILYDEFCDLCVSHIVWVVTSRL